MRLTGDERVDAEKREEEARIWISGLEAVKAKMGVKMIYDLSATPFFLRGSGYSEGTLFPWVVSDFSLIDAIEAGIVQVPRVPVADDAMIGEQPTYRDLWYRVRDSLPKKGRRTNALGGEPILWPNWKGRCTACTAITKMMLPLLRSYPSDTATCALVPAIFHLVGLPAAVWAFDDMHYRIYFMIAEDNELPREAIPG